MSNVTVDFDLVTVVDQVNASVYPSTEDLDEIYTLCKGNAYSKGYALGQLETKLVDVLTTSQEQVISLQAANLLRLLSTGGLSKLGEDSCRSLVHLLASTTVQPLRIALCAIMWNLGTSGVYFLLRHSLQRKTTNSFGKW
eukprot:TRINITY_DN18528_c0_g1_i1.p1 TRINITY_DN18528_c0_g1~~TRINITY_DN18528_c0_g1_i1.p1  ORF type:complete len:140 (-),score=18.48 TRINITY_DN18528_c0_g1_i1:139-558(-)